MAESYKASGALYLKLPGHRVILRAPRAVAGGGSIFLVSGTWATAAVALRWSSDGIYWTTVATITGPSTGGDFGGTSGTYDSTRADYWCAEVMTAEPTDGIAQVNLEAKGEDRSR